MKKIIFFSLEDGWLGGVASVNMSLEPALQSEGLAVKDLFLRGCAFPRKAQDNHTVLRKDCPWEYISGASILDALRKKKPLRAARLLCCRLRDKVRCALDFHKARAYFKREDPDCIVVSHYLLLPAIPKKYLSRTLHHIHTSFAATVGQKANEAMLRRYNGKIGFLWLSRGICTAAQKAGFENSFYVYNPLPFYPEKRCEAEKMKTVRVITRLSPEKRLDLAVRLLQKAMARLPDPDAFSVEFWGTGPEEETLRQAIGQDPRFALCGETKDPRSLLSECRFTLNTSSYEGFSISILEAAAAGVPAVSFRFGEAAEEEILSGETGFLADMDDEEAFVNALSALMGDDALCKKLSEGARAHAKRFRKEEITRSWLALLSHLPLDKSAKA